MWVVLRMVQGLLLLAGIALAIAVIPGTWHKSSQKLAFAGIMIPFLISLVVFEDRIKRSRRRSLGEGIESEGFTLYANASAAGVSDQLAALRKPGFQGYCPIIGVRKALTDSQIAAEFDREEGRGRHSATIYYSIVAVRCNPRWPSTVIYRWSWLNWQRGTPFLRPRPAWMRGLFRWRMVVEPVDSPQPEFLNRSLRWWLLRSSWRSREHWSVDGGWLLLCRRGRLTRRHVRQLLGRCERFKQLGEREEW